MSMMDQSFCLTIAKCHRTLYEVRDGVLHSVGIYYKDDEQFIVKCAKDIVGCQHIHTRRAGSLIFIEFSARLLQGEPGA